MAELSISNTKLMEIKECCKTCRYGCRHNEFPGDTYCVWRGHWQISEIKGCAGYKMKFGLRLKRLWTLIRCK